MNSYILKIFLYETDPQVWRRFSVPETATFSELHQIIQKAMGWNDEQAHQFRYGKGRHLKQVIANTNEQVGPGDEFTDEKDITIAQFAGRRKLPVRLMYRYDFFDDWTHELVIEEKRKVRTRLRCWAANEPARQRTAEDPSATRSVLLAMLSGWTMITIQRPLTRDR